MPSRPPPSALAWVSAAIGPPIQRWKKQPATRSPALTRVTPVADLDHLAGAVRERNDVRLHRHAVGAEHDRQIAEIERAGRDLDQHLARPRLRRGQIDLDQGVDAGALRQLIGAHGVSSCVVGVDWEKVWPMTGHRHKRQARRCEASAMPSSPPGACLGLFGQNAPASPRQTDPVGFGSAQNARASPRQTDPVGFVRPKSPQPHDVKQTRLGLFGRNAPASRRQTDDASSAGAAPPAGSAPICLVHDVKQPTLRRPGT